MAPDRELEQPARKAELGLEPARKPEEEWDTEAAGDLEVEESSEFGPVTEAAKQALTEGAIAEELLLDVSESHCEALEALAIARKGVEEDAMRASVSHVSAPARLKLLNQALTELQSVFAPAMGPEHRVLHEELMEVAELTEQLRGELRQRILLESAKGGVGDREETLESEEDEASEGDEEVGKKKPKVVVGFGALLAGARRREKAKKKKKKKGQKGKKAGEDDDDGSTL